MRLYILRHGIAEDRRPDLPDGERRLTPTGIARLERAARGMQLLGLRFDLIRTSPLARAHETAVIVAAALGLEDRLVADGRLACGADLPDYRAMLAAAGEEDHVLLVGHEPDGSSLIHTLTGGAARMKKASLACLDVHSLTPGGACLRWLLECAHLEAVAEG